MADNKASNRVALFLPDLGGGGAERVMLTLAKGFVNHELEVDLVLVQAVGPYLPDVPAGVRIVNLGSRRVVASIPKLARYLWQRKPEAVLSTLTHANIALLLAKMLARSRARVVLREANVIHEPVKNASTFKERLLPLLMRCFYRCADRVVAVSHQVAAELRALGLPEAKIAVVPNPVDLSVIRQAALSSPEHPWFQQRTPPIILGVGRLTKQKDFGTLIRAFALLRQRREARLVILGEGEERGRLEELIRNLKLENEVALLGFMRNPFAYMGRAAVLVLSSKSEGLPNVLIQAMALGTPVVSTDCPSGPREILEDGKYGKIVPVGDAEALATAITETLDAPPDGDALRERAKAFSLDAVVPDYLSILGLRKG